MDNQPRLVNESPSEPRSGLLTNLGWFASGAVLPIGSLSYYRKASQRPAGLAILFFFLFTAVFNLVTTISVGVTLGGVVKDIQAAYQKGTIPVITIHSGIAEVDGPQPVILYNGYTSSGGALIVVDTTGQITSIDRTRYSQGILLTRTNLQVLNSDGSYQNVPLSEINSLFEKDPLIINQEAVSNAWVTFSVIFSVIAFIFLELWYSLVRLMVIAMIAVILWGIGSLIRPKVGFDAFLICGLYAVVPAIYLTHLLNRANIYFFLMQTILLMIFWIAGLVASLAPFKFFSMDLPARSWTAMIGVPMLVWFICDDFVKLRSPYGPILLWAVALLTGLILIIVRLTFHLQDYQKLTSAGPGTPPQAG